MTDLDTLPSLVAMVDQRRMRSEQDVSDRLAQFDHVVLQPGPIEGRPLEDSHRIRSMLGYLRGRRAYAVGDLETSIESHSTSIAASIETGNVRRQVVASVELALCYELNGGPIEPATLALEALALAKESSEPWTIGRATYGLASLHMLRYSHLDSLTRNEEALEISRSIGDDALACYAESATGLCLANLGRFDESVVRVRRALDRCGDDLPLVEAYTRAALFFVLHGAGRLDEAISAGDEWMGTADAMAEPHAAAYFVALADLHLDAGNLDFSAELLAQVAERTGPEFRSHDTEFHQVRGRLLAARSEYPQAYEAMRRVTELQERAIEQSRNQLVAVHQHRQDELLATNRLLSEENDQKQEILEVVAHDLRSPLSAIRYTAQALLEADAPDPATGASASVEALTNVAQLADEMTSTVGSLLTPDADRQVGPTRVGDILEQVAARHRPFAEARRISLESEHSDDFVNADPDKLRRIIDNLISNSIKFCSEGGSIELRCRKANSFVIVSVVDDGRGFDHEQLARVFERSEAVHEPENPPDSHGLGLYISKRFAEEMGGDVIVRSPGRWRGTEVEVHLRATD